MRSSFAEAPGKAGGPQAWLSVRVAFEEGRAARDTAGGTKTDVDGHGTATATTGRIGATIAATRQWAGEALAAQARPRTTAPPGTDLIASLGDAEGGGAVWGRP